MCIGRSLQQLDLQYSFLNQERIKILGEDLEDVDKGDSESSLGCGFPLVPTSSAEVHVS